jgi:hypothetical protein
MTLMEGYIHDIKYLTLDQNGNKNKSDIKTEQEFNFVGVSKKLD